MAEQPLAGGNITKSVVRIGNTVHRSRSDRSDFASKVLTYLEAIEFPYAPRYLGVDDQGRDTLSFIPGRTTDPAAVEWAESSRALVEEHRTLFLSESH